MGMFDRFTNTPTAPVSPAPTGQPQPVQPGNFPAAPTVTADPNNPTAPVADTSQPVIEEKNESPLDEYSKLWDTDPNKKDETTNQPVPLDQNKVQEVIAKADFSKSIPPEMLAAITEGGEGATAAMAQMMNHVAQQVMTQSIVANSKLNEKAINDALTAQAATFPEMLRKQAAADHLKTSNPIFNNPAIKPVMEATQAQMLQKYPNDTHEQITKRVQDFILAMGEQFAPPAPTDKNAAGEVNWDNFLEG